ncbi:MAG: dTMP kinase [Clostridiales bacterium]|nr:dTMP kinase [Clostridiales bacterium]
MQDFMDMRPHRLPGRLLTFCGLDGCGKTTSIRLLENWLAGRGCEVLLTKQPTNFVRETPIFRSVQDTPDHQGYDYRALSLMAAADRLQHCAQVIVPALREGKIVVSDRYFFSCLANLRARGYKEDRWIDEIARHIPRPDAAFFLDVDPDEAIARVRSRPEEKDRFIDVPLQRRLRREYLDIARRADGIVVPTDKGVFASMALIRDAVDQVLWRPEQQCAHA